jgi:hypothetical protein
MTLLAARPGDVTQQTRRSSHKRARTSFLSLRAVQAPQPALSACCARAFAAHAAPAHAKVQHACAGAPSRPAATSCALRGCNSAGAPHTRTTRAVPSGTHEARHTRASLRAPPTHTRPARAVVGAPDVCATEMASAARPFYSIVKPPGRQIHAAACTPAGAKQLHTRVCQHFSRRWLSVVVVPHVLRAWALHTSALVVPACALHRCGCRGRCARACAPPRRTRALEAAASRAPRGGLVLLLPREGSAPFHCSL